MRKTHVITDYNGCKYITAGKVYEVVEAFGDLIDFVDDTGELVTNCSPDHRTETSAHLNNIGSFRWATEEEIND